MNIAFPEVQSAFGRRFAQIDELHSRGFGGGGDFRVFRSDIMQAVDDGKPALDGIQHHGAQLLGEAAPMGGNADDAITRRLFGS